jgi:hypothetical protein
MQRLHFTVLMDIAPQIAEAFRSDPEVDELFDPAVFIGADNDDCAAAVVERLQLAEVMSGVDIIHGNEAIEPTLDGRSIAVLVMDKISATFYSVPDPRTNPELWPWAGNRD